MALVLCLLKQKAVLLKNEVKLIIETNSWVISLNYGCVGNRPALYIFSFQHMGY